MTDKIRVKHKITGIVSEIPVHFLDIPALVAPYELTSDEPECLPRAAIPEDSPPDIADVEDASPPNRKGRK